MDVSSIHSTTFSNFRLELINIRWRLSSSSHLWFLLCAFPFSIFLKHFSPSFHAIELEFLRKRQVAWEESFRDLYYMLRKNICGLFYGNYTIPSFPCCPYVYDAFFVLYFLFFWIFMCLVVRCNLICFCIKIS